jgi:hypothetical protein
LAYHQRPQLEANEPFAQLEAAPAKRKILDIETLPLLQVYLPLLRLLLSMLRLHLSRLQI